MLLAGCTAATLCLGGLATARAQVILIDFSNLTAAPANHVDTVTGFTWNTVGDSGTVSASLVNSLNAATGLTLSYTVPVSGGGNNVGSLSTAALPSWIGSGWISQDSVFINAATLSMTLAGLTAGQSYNFEFYGARGNASSPVTNNRTTLYSVTSGSSTGSAELNTANNTSATVNFTIIANSSGVATMSFGIGTGNDSGFGYLNAVKITAVPEPGAASLTLAGAGLAALVMIRRRAPRGA